MKLFLQAVAILAAVFIGGALLSKSAEKSRPPANQVDPVAEAYLIGGQMAARHIPDPDAAEWSIPERHDDSRTGARALGSGCFEAYGYCRYVNSSGRPEYRPWRVVFDSRGTSPQALFIDSGGKTFGDYTDALNYAKNSLAAQ